MFFVRFALVVTVSALVVACGGTDASPATTPSPAPSAPSN